MPSGAPRTFVSPHEDSITDRPAPLSGLRRSLAYIVDRRLSSGVLAFVMPVQFTSAQIDALAALAQLELSPAEAELFAGQLGDFLGYAAEVQAVDTTGVTPTAYVVTRQESDRPDEVHASLDRQAALNNAPEPAREAGLFKVPRVIG